MSKREDTVLLSLSYFWSARAPIPLVNVINFSDPSAVTVRQLLKKLVTLLKLKPPPSSLQVRTFSSWSIRDHLNLTSFFSYQTQEFIPLPETAKSMISFNNTPFFLFR